MAKSFGVCGVSYKETPIEIREKLAIDKKSLNLAIPFLKKKCDLEELVIISTCNRVELYYVSESESNQLPQAIAEYLSIENFDPNYFFQYLHSEAMQHLFRVAASLEAMVIGEPQILGQVKQCYNHAKVNGGVKFFLNKIFQKSFEIAKRIRQETSISKFAVSISFAAVELARRIFENLDGKQVLIIGAGEMAELAAANLKKAGCSRFMVINRTFTNAVELAKKFSGSAFPFEDLENVIAQADIIISSTGASGFILNQEQVQAALKKRKNNSIFLIDIAVPRDFDPKINELANAYLYDIDDLQNVVSSNLEERKKEAKKAELIVKEELSKFENWFQSLDILPTVKSLREKFHQVASEELSKFLPSFKDEELKEKLEQFTHSLVHKFLHHPTVNLKETYDDPAEMSSIIQKLFQLEVQETEQNSKVEIARQNKVLNFKKGND